MKLLLKPLKLVLWIVGLLVVALLGAGLFADSLAKKGIEAGGSAALGVPVAVAGCDVGFFSGTFGMKGLTVANPEGYEAPNFLELDTGHVEVGVLSLLGETVEVPQLTLSGIRLDLVQDVQGSNYGTILSNLERFQGQAEGPQGEGKRFVIKRLLLEQVQVSVAAAPSVGLAAVKVPIDRIELQDVGSESEGGVLLSDLAGIVVEAVLKRASATGMLPGLVQGALDGRLGQLQGLAAAHVKGLQDLLGGKTSGGNLPKPVEDARKDIEGRLKGLLGK